MTNEESPWKDSSKGDRESAGKSAEADETTFFLRPFRPWLPFAIFASLSPLLPSHARGPALA